MRRDDDSEFGGKTTGSAAYGFAITPQWRVTASAGTAFRVPTLYQRFSEYGVGTLQARRRAATSKWACATPKAARTAGIVRLPQPRDNLITFDGAPAAAHRRSAAIATSARAVYEGVTLSASHRSAT